jgi:hypothetical protein
VPADEKQDALQSLKFVGPATAAVLEDAGVAASDVESKAVTHAELVDYGVNPGVAARIRREHSLQWSFEGGEDLGQRAEQVRGLQDDEREWVAASYGEDDASADGSGDATAEEAAWRDQPAGLGDDDSSGAGGDDATAAESAWQSKSWPNGDDEESALERSERAWRQQSTPTPVTVLDEIADGDAKLLARAGVTSVRSLATTHVQRVADSLRISEDLVATWTESAREHEE